MTTWNFGEGRFEYSAVLRKTHRRFLFDAYGQKMWQIVINATTLNNTDLWFDGYIECFYKSRKSTLWSCYAEIELQAKNNYAVTPAKREGLVFDSRSKVQNLAYFSLTAEDCFPDGNERVVKEAFNFVVNFHIISLVGVQNRQISDFSSSRNIDSEVIVLVGDQRLYVDKYPLMCFSPVLGEIINNGMNSSNAIEIKDAKVEDVVAFLRLLYHQKPPIKYENLEGLMSLIIRYDAQCVIPVVEEELISTVRTTVAQKLHIVELYGFSELQKVAFKQQEIEKQREMEQPRRLLERQLRAGVRKETSDMIRLLQRKANEDEHYVEKKNDLVTDKEILSRIKESIRLREKEA